MKRASLERVFGRSRLKMVTGRYVEVYREEAAPGERRRYTKRFLATKDGDFRVWTEREWRILALLVGHGARHVPDIVQYQRGDDGGEMLVQTYDAGPTVDHWARLLPVQRGGRVQRHIFQDCAHWWALARHLLLALHEIHALGVVHLDLKADNICLPLASPDVDLQARELRLLPAFANIALIDLAFAVVSGEALTSPLPLGLQQAFRYQSPRLLKALAAGKNGDLELTQQLDWRCDMYSMAALLNAFLPTSEALAGAGVTRGWTPDLRVEAKALVTEIRASHDGVLVSRLPHPPLAAACALQLQRSELADSLQRSWIVIDAAGVDDPFSDAMLSAPLTRHTFIEPPQPVYTAPTEILPVLPIDSPLAPVAVAASVVAPIVMQPEEPPVAEPFPIAPVETTRVEAAPPTAPAVGAGSLPLLISPRWASAPATPSPPPPPVPVPRTVDTVRHEEVPAAATFPVAPVETIRVEAAPPAAPPVMAGGPPPWLSPTWEPAPATSLPPQPAAPEPGPVRATRREQMPPAITFPVVPEQTIRVPEAPPAAPAVVAGDRPPLLSPTWAPEPAIPSPPQPPAAARSRTRSTRTGAIYVLPALAVVAALAWWLFQDRKPPVVDQRASSSARAGTVAAPAPVVTPPTVAASPALPAAARPAPLPTPPLPSPADVRGSVTAAAEPEPAKERVEPRPPQNPDRVVSLVVAGAEPRVADALSLAGRSRSASDDRRIAAAAASIGDGAFERAGAALASAQPAQARQLAATARRAFQRQRSVARAYQLQRQAFAAQPGDAEIAGNLAFYALRMEPPRAEEARAMAIHALALSARAGGRQRPEDWGQLAVASALGNRASDARNAMLVMLSVSRDVNRSCRVAVRSVARHGQAMRAPAEALLRRAQERVDVARAPQCRLPANWRRQ